MTETYPRIGRVVSEDLDQLWDDLRAAVIVLLRVDTPEVRAEVERARDALIEALDTS